MPNSSEMDINVQDENVYCISDSSTDVVEDILDDVLYQIVHDIKGDCDIHRETKEVDEQAIETMSREMISVLDLVHIDDRLEVEEATDTPHTNSMFYLYNSYFRAKEDMAMLQSSSSSSSSSSMPQSETCTSDISNVAPAIDTWARAAVNTMNVNCYHRKPWSVAAKRRDNSIESHRKKMIDFNTLSDRRNSISSSSSNTDITSTQVDKNDDERQQEALQNIISSIKTFSERDKLDTNTTSFKSTLEAVVWDKARMHNVQNDILMPKVVQVRKRSSIGRSAEMRRKMKADKQEKELLEKYAEYNSFVQNGREMFANCKTRPLSAPVTTRNKRSKDVGSGGIPFVSKNNNVHQGSRLKEIQSVQFSKQRRRPNSAHPFGVTIRRSTSQNKPAGELNDESYVDADIDEATVRTRSEHNLRLERQRRERFGGGTQSQQVLKSGNRNVQRTDDDAHPLRPQSAIQLTTSRRPNNSNIQDKVDRAIQDHIDRIKNKDRPASSNQRRMKY